METGRNKAMPGRLSNCCSQSTLRISPVERWSPLQGCSPAGDPSWEKQAEGSLWGLLTFPPPMWEWNNSSLYTTPWQAWKIPEQRSQTSGSCVPGASVRPGKEPKTSPANVASLLHSHGGQPARQFQQWRLCEQDSYGRDPCSSPHPILTSGSCRHDFSAGLGRQPKPFPQTSPISY